MNILQWRKRSIVQDVRVLTWLSLTLSSTTRSLYCWASPACSIKHIHLSVGKSASTQMTISFAAERHSVDLWPLEMLPTAHVKIGTGPNAFTRLAKSNNPKRYSTVDKGRTYNSPYYYHVEINDLEPSTTYYYECFLYDEGTVQEERTDHGTYNGTFTETQEESNEDGLRHSRKRYLPQTKSSPMCISRTPVRSFQTAPTGYTMKTTTKATTKEPTGAPVTFALLGDLGRSKEAKDTLKHMYNHCDKFDAAVLLGDIAYTDGKYHFQRQWDEWFDILDEYPTFERKPLQIAAGNHDIELRTETGGDIFTSYGHRFLMPQVQPVETSLYPQLDSLDMEYVMYPLHYDFGNAFYSFTYGPAFMIVLNSYSNMDPGSPQYHWLTNELDSIDRSITPWVFVMLHCPMYNTFSRHTRDVQIQKGKEYLEPLMYGYRVNGVFAGHIHAYSRSKPLYQDKVNPRGPIHWIVGEGGKTLNAQFRTGIPEEWVAVRDATVYGYGLLELLNATTARWEWIHTGDVEREFNSAVDTPNATWPSVEMDNFYFSNQLYIEE